MHGHLFDEGELDRLDELFTGDVVYDVRDFGQEPLRGIDAIREAALELGGANPLAHHVTNIVITEVDDDTAAARSKGLGVIQGGKLGSVTYVDIVRRGADGWRISNRKVLGRRVALGGRGEPRSSRSNTATASTSPEDRMRSVGRSQSRYPRSDGRERLHVDRGSRAQPVGRWPR